MAISRTGTYSTNNSTGQVTTLASNGNLTLGSLLLVMVEWQSQSNIPTVSDSKGNTWTGNPFLSYYDSTDKDGLALYYTVNTQANGASDTININYNNGSTNYSVVTFSEWLPGSGYSWNGTDGTGAAQLVTGVTSGGTASSTSFNTSVSGDLIYACGEIAKGNTPTISIGSGFTVDQIPNITTNFGYNYIGTEYLIQGSAGGTVGSWVDTDAGQTNDSVIILCAAFKLAAAAAYQPFVNPVYGPILAQ
jgi:hypothetical protein